jgi:hypothetical protein
VLEGHFRHPSAGCFDQQGGATRTDVPVADHFRNVELRRYIPPEIGANLLICPPDKRHIRFPASLPNDCSYLLQAQSSGAKIVRFANGGTDTINSVKQAMEFGLQKYLENQRKPHAL